MNTTPLILSYPFSLTIKFNWITADIEYIDCFSQLRYTFLSLTEMNTDMISDIDYDLKVMFVIGDLTEESFYLNDFCINFKNKEDMMLAKLRLD